MTDDEWAYFEPFLIHRGGGRPPRNHRRVLDAVFWLMRAGHGGAICRRNRQLETRFLGSFGGGPAVAFGT